MFVLLTTSNFPMVMLPSYNSSRVFCLFYILFLVIGLFLLMNLLLAIFYSNYQNKTELAIDSFAKKRSSYVLNIFQKLDNPLTEDLAFKKGYLDKSETKELFEELHSLFEK
jgi:two pore calcium channel protein